MLKDDTCPTGNSGAIMRCYGAVGSDHDPRIGPISDHGFYRIQNSEASPHDVDPPFEPKQLKLSSQGSPHERRGVPEWAGNRMSRNSRRLG